MQLIPDWVRAKRRSVTSELRQNFVHAHGVALNALGLVGRQFFKKIQTAGRNSFVVSRS